MFCCGFLLNSGKGGVAGRSVLTDTVHFELQSLARVVERRASAPAHHVHSTPRKRGAQACRQRERGQTTGRGGGGERRGRGQTTTGAHTHGEQRACGKGARTHHPSRIYHTQTGQHGSCTASCCIHHTGRHGSTTASPPPIPFHICLSRPRPAPQGSSIISTSAASLRRCVRVVISSHSSLFCPHFSSQHPLAQPGIPTHAPPTPPQPQSLPLSHCAHTCWGKHKQSRHNSTRRHRYIHICILTHI